MVDLIIMPLSFVSAVFCANIVKKTASSNAELFLFNATTERKLYTGLKVFRYLFCFSRSLGRIDRR